MLPRTNSDLLQADSMTAGKVTRYGQRIMSVLKPFWAEVDGESLSSTFYCIIEREQHAIREQLETLRNTDPVLGGFANAPQVDLPPGASGFSDTPLPNGKILLLPLVLILFQLQARRSSCPDSAEKGDQLCVLLRSPEGNERRELRNNRNWLFIALVSVPELVREVQNAERRDQG